MMEMSSSKKGHTCSKKVRCFSREVSADECLWTRVDVTEDDIARFCLSQRSLTAVKASEGFSFSVDTT